METFTLKSDLLKKAKQIANCLQLAILLESEAHKPGNISLVTDFENTHYEHFLASAVAVSSSFERAAEVGFAVSEGRIEASQIGVGHVIKDCIENINAWQHGGNTLLGTVILLSPMATAAGMTLAKKDFEVASFRKNLKTVVESTTSEDAVNLYSAIETANPGGLGKAPDLDVTDPGSKQKILDDGIRLYDVFKIAEKYDTICSEWTSNYQLTFNIAYPTLRQRLNKDPDPSEAIVQTFLELLSQVPDTFIARKAGNQKAHEVSLEARRIVDLGGVETTEGRESLRKFDRQLRRSGNLLNPGTTADIVAAGLAVCTLNGYRP
jgi:triphosphoribosyl-dephospho-CoA synthase